MFADGSVPASTAAVDGRLTASVPSVVGVAASPEVMVLTLTRPASEFEVPDDCAVLDVVAHQVIAGRIDEVAFRVGDERAVAGEIEVAVGIGDDEIAVALDGEVGGGRGADHRALQRVHVADARRDAAARRCGAADRVDNRRKLGLGVLVAGGVGVGDVLGNVRQPGRVAQHAGHGGAHQTHRSLSSRLCNVLNDWTLARG